MLIEIIPFEAQYNKNFRELSIAWLEKYFYVEEKDKELLENCEKSIINKGGYIFFAKMDGNVVGCFSYIPHNEKMFELGKMAVDPKYQGHKIGQTLLNYAIQFAKEKQWSKIMLYSSTKLPTALHIYEKHGFKHVELEKDLPYARSDIKMELVL